MTSSARIHATADVSPHAVLEEGVEVGPFCIVSEGVVLGPYTRLIASCMVLGNTHLGARNVVHPYAVLGGEPQDRTYCGEPTRLCIGDDNVFREHVTVHRGTTKDCGVTRIGSGGLFMVGSHIAHDCELGDFVTLANATLLGGHVRLEDHVITGGNAGIIPFVHVGSTTFVAGRAVVEQSLPPFVIAAGDRARVRALNRVGLVRRGIPPTSMQALKQTFSRMYQQKLPRSEAVRTLPPTLRDDLYVQEFLRFFEPAVRDLCRGLSPLRSRWSLPRSNVALSRTLQGI